MLECVVNISEGRDRAVIAAIAVAAGPCLLDSHSDADHHRTVLTLAGPEVEDAARAVAARTVELVDLNSHHGVHPRLGAVDVVPFVPLDDYGAPQPGNDLTEALQARGRFALWAADALGLPCFLYGPERPLPDVRRQAFTALAPDTGPPRPHPRAGACAVGARPVLVAYNLWLDTADVAVAKTVAAGIRGPSVRALGLAAGGAVQVSCNLIDPLTMGPADVFDAVATLAADAGADISRAELVGLAPRAVVESVPTTRRPELDLDLGRTIEARLQETADRERRSGS